MRKDLVDMKNLLTLNAGRGSKPEVFPKHSENVVQQAGTSQDEAITETDMNESITSIEEFIADPSCLAPSEKSLN